MERDDGLQHSAGSIRFGPFEVSPQSGELRKYGTRVKLSGQAIQVLTILLEQPGRIVTRQELQEKLWPGASYGDFEHGLNAVVNRLRDVLGDSATEPKFVETVPRRGYRFIGRIEPESVPRESSTPVSLEGEKLSVRDWQRRHWALSVLGQVYFWPNWMASGLTRPRYMRCVCVSHIQLSDSEVSPSRNHKIVLTSDYASSRPNLFHDDQFCRSARGGGSSLSDLM